MAREESKSPVLPADEGSSSVTQDKARGETSLKRGRAESVEPPQHTETPANSISNVKKNRLAPSTGQTPSNPLDPASGPNLDHKANAKATVVDPNSITEEGEEETEKETRNVGEVRRKVEEMSYDEKLQATKEKAEATRAEEVWDGKASAADTADKDGNVAGEQVNGTDEGKEGLKRKALDRSQSSFTQEEVEAKRLKDEADAKDAKDQATTAPVAKKPQATFSSFSSASSPFASKPSAFASAGSSSPFGAASGSSSAPNAFAKSGFGNYSSSFSPFAKTAPSAPTEEKGEADKEATSTSFGDILSADVGEEEEEDTGKVKMTEQDVHTGEEEENTVYQTRTKLYVMQSDGGWRERGVGTVKINVRASDNKGARLVMRAEGVLRLILNVSLYVGMSCLEDGKHVRVTVFEDGERKFITFRTGSNKVAGELYQAIMDHVPIESTKEKQTV